MPLIKIAKKEIEKQGGSPAVFFSKNHAFFDKSDLPARRYIDLYAQLLYKHPDQDSREKIRYLARTLYQNRQIIDNIGLSKELENFRLSKINDDSIKNYVEYIDDFVRKRLMEAYIKNFVKKELSGSPKYLEFYQKNKEKIDEILNLGGKKQLKMLFHKIEKLVNEPQEEIDRLLEIVKNNLTNLSSRLEQAKDSKIVFSDDDFVVVHVGSYDDIVKLGSPAWCIQRNEIYWKSYVAFPNRQYIVYDKNGDILYGVTIDSSGEIEACHDKNDSPYNPQKIPDIITQNFVPMPREAILDYLNKNQTKNVVTTAGFGLVDELNEELNLLKERKQSGKISEMEYNKLMSTALVAASNLGTIETVNRLLREDFYVDQEYTDAILDNVLSRSKKEFPIKVLFTDKRFNLQNKRNSLLKKIASSNYDIDVKEILDSQFIDPSIEITNILSIAIRSNKKKFIKSYLSHKKTSITLEQMERLVSLAKKAKNKDILTLLEKINAQKLAFISDAKEKTTPQKIIPPKRIKKLFYDE